MKAVPYGCSDLGYALTLGCEVKEMTLETIPGNWKAYYQNISDVLNKGAELAVKPAEVRENMRLIDAIVKSAETGASVKM